MKQTISLILSLFLFTSTICVAQTDGKSLAIEGLKYYNGKVVEKNLEKAAGFFRQSAEAGDMVFPWLLLFQRRGYRQKSFRGIQLVQQISSPRLCPGTV